jgi:hypothetical protein
MGGNVTTKPSIGIVFSSAGGMGVEESSAEALYSEGEIAKAA